MKSLNYFSRLFSKKEPYIRIDSPAGHYTEVSFPNGSPATKIWRSARTSLSKIKVLLIAFYDPAGLATIAENVRAWAELSTHQVDVLNLYGGIHSNGLEIPKDFPWHEYDAVVIHCTVSYNVDNLISLDRASKKKFVGFNGLKILMKQDEHYKPHRIAKFVGDARFDCIITIVPEPDRTIFYPRKLAGEVDFISSHTAYISSSLRSMGAESLSLNGRALDIVYRGSIQPASFGWLAYQKREIGDRAKIELEKFSGLQFDISSRWEDRYLGNEWFKFLRKAKAVLGAESGASIVDFDGSIEKEQNEYMKLHPDAPFERLYDDVLKKYEGNAQYRAISPRHFEAIATGTVQILYPGEYSGLLTPDRHYLRLEPDFSNFQEVVARALNPEIRNKIVHAAYEEVLLNESLSYHSFINRVDDYVSRNCIK